MRVYNKFEEDFETEDEWNLYLEEIEDIIYSLTHDVNRLETEKKIEAYEKLNKDEIRKNFGRK